MTENQKQYRKQINRIKRAIKRLEKEGFIIPSDIIPLAPERISKKRISTLKSITPQAIRIKSQVIDIETGEVAQPSTVEHREALHKIKLAKKQARNVARKTSIPKTQAKLPQSYIPTLTITDRIIEYISSIPSWRGFGSSSRGFHQSDFSGRKNELISILNDRIANTSDVDLEQYFQSNEDKIMEKIEVIKYDSDENTVEASWIALAVIIKGTSLTHEEAEDISLLAEQYENWNE